MLTSVLDSGFKESYSSASPSDILRESRYKEYDYETDSDLDCTADDDNYEGEGVSESTIQSKCQF